MRKIHKNCAILIPTYNDWKSLNKLISEINSNASNIAKNVSIFIVNDGSTKKQVIAVKKFKKIKRLKVINLKKNFGSQISIALGLNQLKKWKINSDIVVMDSDGEDNPNKIPLLLNKLDKNRNKMIVASRSKRKEVFLLKLLNEIRLFITIVFTGKNMNFGNFSAFKSDKLKFFFEKKDILLAYCAGVSKNMNILRVPIKKEYRYYGSSKVNFKFLIKYSLNILSVYRYSVLFRSLVLYIFCFIFNMIYKDFSDLLKIISISLIFLNSFIFYIYRNEKSIFFYKKFIKSAINIK